MTRALTLLTALLSLAACEATEHVANGADELSPVGSSSTDADPPFTDTHPLNQAPSSPAEPPLSEAECRDCHAEVAAQWRDSRHHLAFDNPDFQRAFAREPKDFCRDCHAPGLTRSGAQALTAPEAEALGVGCLDCHVDPQRPDAVLTQEWDSSQGPSPAPHPLTPVAEFGTHSCARCHEFDFPPGSTRPEGTMMQTTMREHQASAHADRSCADCHLPEVGEGALAGRDHSLASTRDPAAMRAAIEVQARREGDALVLALTPCEVGHALPTGDLFRRLELHAQLRIGDEIIATQTRYLARHFEPRRRPDGRLNQAYRRPVVDDRLRGPTTIELALDGQGRGHEALLEWWVDYERVDARIDSQPELSTLADELRLAEGQLPSE